MIRLVRALTWLRWRILVNTLRSGRRRRDAFEVVSRFSELLTRAMWLLLLVPAAAGLAFGAAIGGALAVSSEDARFGIQVVARIVLGLVTFGLVLAPLVRSAQGMGQKLERLLLLPISRRALHAGDVLAQLSDPWVAITIPAIALLPVGLAAGGGWAAAVWVALAGAAMLFALASLGGAIGWGVALLFRDRRRGETLTLVLLIALALAGFLPAMYSQRLEDAARKRERPPSVSIEHLSGWIAPLPSELYGGVVLDAVEGRHGAASWRVAALAGIGTALFAASSALHRRTLAGTSTGFSRRNTRGVGLFEGGLPFAGQPVSAVAQAFLRLTLRTVRGRMAVYFTPVPLVLMVVIFGGRFTEELSERWLAASGPLLLLFAAAVTFLALQPVVLNQFAVCGPGLTLECLAPLTSRQIVAGRLAGSGWLSAIAYALSAAGMLAVSPRTGALLCFAAIVAAIAAFAILAPSFSVLSALFPKASDLGRIGRAGNPHQLASVIGVFLTAGALAPGVVVLVFVGILANRPGLALLAELLWLAVATAAAYPLSVIAASAFDRRRENLLLVAAGR